MRPPIPVGTVLQNRYRVLSVLGQGGFGRTYLVEDQGRFGEMCAMKELTPEDDGGYALQKSKELFQREAQILYQIDHVQIPKFRATFEYDQRLFLVQDYVEGMTYRRLLDQRRAQGYAFSEAEVKQLLLQLLPVLAHIHSKGIIHRDITPDNIILRESDRLPVLIDFGVVKELATRFQAPGTAFPGTVMQNTTVGKIGYAPPEQMQTGRAYASSDLYSLAVTAVVLLTGREPQELFDDSTFTWYWQRWVNVTSGFAQVLNKMLNYRPGDRYQTAGEVMQALQSAPIAAPQFQPSPATYPVQPGYAPPMPTAAPTQTVAVGRNVEPDLSNTRSASSIDAPRNSVWDDPLALMAIGLGLLIITGIAAWAIVRAVLSPPIPSTPSPSASITTPTSPSPSTSPSSSPTSTPSPKPSEPVTYSQRLDLAPDTRLIREGSLRSNETINYIISGQQGQQLSALLSGNRVLMSVLGPNREPLTDSAQRVSYWQGTLPYNGDYFVQLRPVQGVGRSDYRMELNLKSSFQPSPPPSPSPTYTPEPPRPNIDTQRVQFPPGATGTVVSGGGNPYVIRRYLVNARRGQILSTRVLNGSVTLTIHYPSGRVVEDATNVLSWESELPRDGDYQIDVVANQRTRFDVDISVKDLTRSGVSFPTAHNYPQLQPVPYSNPYNNNYSRPSPFPFLRPNPNPYPHFQPNPNTQANENRRPDFDFRLGHHRDSRRGFEGQHNRQFRHQRSNGADGWTL